MFCAVSSCCAPCYNGRMPIKQDSKTAGFTLNEVLIVAAIVAVLTTVLLAVFVRTRENSRITMCHSTLKQISLATLQYAQDNDDTLPNNFWRGQIHPYLRNANPILCPTFQTSFSKPTPDRGQTAPLVPRRHYMMGYYYNGFDLSPTHGIKNGTRMFSSKRRSHIADPATTWMFAENNTHPENGVGGTLIYSVCDSGGAFEASLHNGGGNYAFADGHVTWLKPDMARTLVCSNESSANFP